MCVKPKATFHMVDHGRSWSTMAEHGRLLSTMVAHGRPLLTMVDHGRPRGANELQNQAASPAAKAMPTALTTEMRVALGPRPPAAPPSQALRGPQQPSAPPPQALLAVHNWKAAQKAKAATAFHASVSRPRPSSAPPPADVEMKGDANNYEN